MRVIIALVVVALAPLSAQADDFKITITDPVSLAGIADARAKYNATLPCMVSNAKLPSECIQRDGEIASDADYVALVVTQAAAQWGKTALDAKINAAVDGCRTGQNAQACADAAALLQQAQQGALK